MHPERSFRGAFLSAKLWCNNLFFFIIALIKKNTGIVENTGAISGATISFTLKTFTNNKIIVIFKIYSNT